MSSRECVPSPRPDCGEGEQSHECDPCSGSGSGPNYMGKECGVTAMAGIVVMSYETAADPVEEKRKHEESA